MCSVYTTLDWIEPFDLQSINRGVSTTAVRDIVPYGQVEVSLNSVTISLCDHESECVLLLGC